LEKAFVVENKNDGDDVTTNHEFKIPLVHKYVWQVITNGIPIVQLYLNSILMKLRHICVDLYNFFKSLNMDRLSIDERKDVTELVKFIHENIGERAISLHYSVKMTDLRRSILHLQIERAMSSMRKRINCSPLQ